MVKYTPVTENIASPPTSPRGVIASLLEGFDRIAARPILILPPLLLDLFLWLGPHMRVRALFDALASSMGAMAVRDATMGEQVQAVKEGIQWLGAHFNLFTALSSLPVGLPSLMAGRLPAETPWGFPPAIEVEQPFWVLGTWIAFTIIGLGLGVFYHLSIARQVAPEAGLAPGGEAWRRVLVLAVLAYGALLGGVAATMLVATLASLVLPLLGAGVLFLGFSAFIWVVVYLIFTPHGIVRFRLAVPRALLESALVVRWFMMSTVGFLGLALIIRWLTNQVWLLPEESSWFTLLALVGHAFISSTLLAASYVYYQSRREWLQTFRTAVSSVPTEGEGPPANLA